MDPFERDEEERLVLQQRAADGPPILFPIEVLERLAVRRVGGQRFEPLKAEQTALHLVRAGLRDHVHDAARRAPVLRVGAGRDDLELLDRLQSDVDRRALAAHLLAEEAIVVIATVEADVVEDAALPGERDLVAVRALDDADAGSEREEILELAAENRRRFNGRLVERAGGRRARGVDSGGLRRDGDGFGDSRHLHDRVEPGSLSHRDDDVLLHQGREASQFERHRVAAGRQLQGREPTVPVRHERAREIGLDVAGLDIDAREHRAAGVRDHAFDDRGRDLRLRRCGRGQCQRDEQCREQVVSRRLHQSTSFERTEGIKSMPRVPRPRS